MRAAVAALLLCLPAGEAANAALLNLAPADVSVSPEADVDIPIRMSGADGLGPLQFDLCYDPELVSPASPAIQAGPASGGAMIESNVVEPGRLRVAMICGQPVSGEGDLLLVSFKAVGPAGQSCDVTLEKVRAWDFENNLAMRVETQPGRVTLGSALVLSARMIQGLLVAVIVLVILILVSGRLRRDR
jgi:hypothetical protein